MEGIDERIAALPVRRLAPPIDRMFGDPDGRLWIRLFRPGAVSKYRSLRADWW